MSNVNVVITGMGGFIGSHLQDSCLLRGWEVYGTTRSDSIASTVELLERVRPQFLFHAAAELGDNSKMFETNVQLTTAILDYCRRDANSSRQLRRAVIFGSSSEYGRKLAPMAEDETCFVSNSASASLFRTW